PRGPYHRPHHPLPGGGRAALHPHRHAEGGPHRGARLDAQPPAELLRPRGAAAAGRRPRPGRRAAAGRSGHRAAPGRAGARPAPRRRARARAGARRASPGGASGARARAAAAGARGRLRAPDREERAVTGFYTLFHKELLRFIKVSIQTIAAPVLTALLYLLVFAQALEGRVRVYEGVPYTEFLVPGLVMMSVLQNAFA